MSKEQDQDIFESEVEETVEGAPLNETNKPWNRKFGENENLKNRQYSRAARNQPAKEATTLSKVLLFIIIITVITPFVLFFWVNSQRNNEEIPTRSAEQITYSRNSELSQSSERSDESESSESIEESSSEEISRESVESVEQEPVTPPTPTEPVYEEPTVVEEPPATTGSYTVQAGDSWYAIARNHGIDVNTLLNANGASTETAIFPGMQIVIP
ncbi:LysM peptidoglycan-binding domain-containing protein [Aerococcaceae bacterium WGS1372]